MKYNKNNTFSGINIYNKLDKDIQEIIDNYLIQMRKEEEQDEGGIIEDLSLDDNFIYRRFMTEFKLHYKFNNSIMKSIVKNDMIYKNSEYEEKYEGSIGEIMYEYLIVPYYEDTYENITSNMIDKLVGSIDYVIGKMFMNKNDNEELFLKVCKILNKNPFRLLSEGCCQSIENYGDSEIFIGDCEETFNYAKILVCYLDNKISEYIMW
tara:strand:- start:1426 stop:2049 length:624 start_codon:yes stop_codon:yes gene_type:complete